MTNKIIKPLALTILTGALLISAFQAHAANTAMMELIEILHNKGSITLDEYELLKKAAIADQATTTATREELKQDVENEFTVAAKKMDGAAWATKVNLKGDVRVRYQAQDNDPGSARDRERIRYRLGITALPTVGWEVGAGLASGLSDLRSTNQTFTDTFSKKPVNLDYAYVQHKFNDKLKLITGKFKFPAYLYTSSDLMWDSDINPEGISANFSHKSDLGTSFANSGYWVLTENGGSDNDPYLIYGQLGQNFATGNIFGAVTGSYYTFEENTALGAFPTTGSNSDFHFSGIYSVSAEFGLSDLSGTGTRASIIADWVTNSDTLSTEDSGYLIGLKAAQGPWSFRYAYAELELNAWPDILPDSDRFEGLTGISGHELVLEYELMTNVLLGLDYYASKNNITDTDQDLLQVDINVRF